MATSWVATHSAIVNLEKSQITVYDFIAFVLASNSSSIISLVLRQIRVIDVFLNPNNMHVERKLIYYI